MASLVSISVILCVSHLLQGGLGAYISFTASKHQINKAESVDVLCTPDGSESNSREIEILQIRGPAGKMLVTIEQNQQIVFDGRLSPRYTAFGDLGEAKLTLTITDPQTEDFGEYSCSVTFKDTDGKVFTHLAKENLMEGDVASIIEKQLSDLRSKVTSLQASVKELSRKANIKSAFSATTNKKLPVAVGKKVALPDVTLSYGLAGYDPKTGTYTVPVNGLYQFNLRMSVYCKNCYLIGYLKANKTTLAGIGIHDKNYYDQTSVSVTVNLKKGDQVFFVPSSVSTGLKVSYLKFSAFDGYLLEAE